MSCRCCAHRSSNVSKVPLTDGRAPVPGPHRRPAHDPDVAAQLTGDTTLTDRMRAAAAVATAKEFLSQERGVVLQALANGKMSQAVRRDYIATQKGQELALLSFTAVTTPEQQELFERTVTGPEVRAALEFEGKLDTLRPDQNPNEVVDPAAWDRAMVGRANLMNEVEIKLNQQAQDAAIALGSSVQRRVLLETGLLLLTLLLGMLFAWLVARSMARSLRDLRQGALAVAQYGLPQAVARLRDPALSSNMSPAGHGAADRRTAAGAQQGRVRSGDRGVQRGPPRSGPDRGRAGRAAVLRRDHVRQPGPPQPDPGRPAHRPPRPARARRAGPGPALGAVPARPPGHPDAPQRREPAGARGRRLDPHPARAGGAHGRAARRPVRGRALHPDRLHRHRPGHRDRRARGQRPGPPRRRAVRQRDRVLAAGHHDHGRGAPGRRPGVCCRSRTAASACRPTSTPSSTSGSRRRPWSTSRCPG